MPNHEFIYLRNEIEVCNKLVDRWVQERLRLDTPLGGYQPSYIVLLSSTIKIW